MQLRFGSSGYKEPVYVREDPGQTIRTVAVRSNGRVLFSVEATRHPYF